MSDKKFDISLYISFFVKWIIKTAVLCIVFYFGVIVLYNILDSKTYNTYVYGITNKKISDIKIDTEIVEKKIDSVAKNISKQLDQGKNNTNNSTLNVNTARKNIEKAIEERPTVQVSPIKISEERKLSENKVDDSDEYESPVESEVVEQEYVQEEVIEDELPYDYSGPNWAVVAENTDFYDKNFNKLGRINGGVCVQTHDKSYGNNVTFYRCNLIKNGVIDKSSEYFIKENYLACFRGPYRKEKLDDGQLAVIEYCKIRGEYDELRSERKKNLIKSNPYYDEYQKVTKEYTDFQEKAKLTKERADVAKGSEKTKLNNELRKMHADQGVLNKKYNDIKKKYVDWRNNNLGEGEDINVKPTYEMERMKKKMDSLYKKANDACPGI